jgi:type III secretion system YscI/HrpB-like protein
MAAISIEALAQQAASEATQSLKSQPVMPAQSDIDEFTRLLMSRGAATPDQTAIEAVAKVDVQAKQRVADATAAADGAPGAEGMLSVQRELAAMSIDIDLAAKLAGSISQGINKLVTMQ